MGINTSINIEQAYQERMAAREQRRKEEQQFRENLVTEIMNEYGFNKAVAECVVRKGWEDGHYAGYNEVRTCSQIAAEFAEEVLKSVEIH